MKVFIAFALLCSSFVAVHAQALTPVCTDLGKQFDYQDRRIAMESADGIGDNSAPRATLRELRTLNGRVQQSMILDVMRSKSCALPSSIGNEILYFDSALKCATAKIKGVYDGPECKLSDWVKMDNQKAVK